MKEKTSEKEIAVHEKSQVDLFIEQAIKSNASIETMERLFALHKEVQAERAKAAFVQALANFQKEVPVIGKTKKVSGNDGKLRYQYAPLDAIHEQIKKPLADNGLAYSWDIIHKDAHMIATVTLTHIDGHSRTSSFEIPVDSGGFMTQPQKYASAQTYAKRYALINVLGITTADEDDDSTTTNKDKDAKDVKAQIVFRLRTLGYETSEKSVIEETVKKLTKLSLVEKNYGEIASRLQALIDEREHDDSKM